MNPFTEAYVDEIASGVAAALGLPVEQVAAAVELPRDLAKGDFALPCFRFAKELRKKPPEIAAAAAEGFAPGDLIERVEQVGPFLNFFVRKEARARRVLEAIHADGVAFGLGRPGEGRTVVLDMSSPNIAKPFHIGHLRSTVIGNALANLFDLLGYRAVRINHLGDWGTQFGHLIAGWQREEWREEALASWDDPIRQFFDVYVKINSLVAEDPAVADEGRAWFAKLEQGDPEATALWKKFRDESLTYFDRIYERLGVTFDHVTGESYYADAGKMGEVVEAARRSGAAVESDGALVIEMEAQNKPPLMLLKKDGATTYATRDVAAALYRHAEFEFSHLLYVVGSPQRLHFEQLFEALARLGHEWAERCHHISFGQYLGLATRKGNVIWLEEVLDEAVERAREKAAENPDLIEDIEATAEQVGIGAIVFNDFMARRNKDIEFDWDRVLNFQGESGPYIMYSHVRTWGILRKAEREVATDVDFALLAEDEDRTLLMLLESWPARVLAAAEEFEPSIVARHLLDLAGAFHSYLPKHRVLGDDEALTAARLLLIDSVRRILAGGLELLGVPAPDRM